MPESERELRVLKLMKRLAAEVPPMMQGQQGQDYVPDENSEVALAGKIVGIYLDEVPDDEASFGELLFRL